MVTFYKSRPKYNDIHNLKNKEEGSFSVKPIKIQTQKNKAYNATPNTKRSLLCIFCLKQGKIEKQGSHVKYKYCGEQGEQANQVNKRYKKLKASITVEVSMVLPIFLIAMLCLLYMLEMMAIQMSVRNAMYEAGNYISRNNLSSSYVSNAQIETQLLTAIGLDSVDNSIIVNESGGLDISSSRVDSENGVVELVVDYKVALPFPRFIDFGLSYRESLVFKRWTGYEGGVYFQDGNVVYITEHQSVYHTNYNCSHLQLQIELVRAGSLEGLVNESGSAYTSCGTCKPGDLESLSYVYTTTTGSRYHSTLECSGLKRTIESVNLEDVIGKGLCQRCA